MWQGNTLTQMAVILIANVTLPNQISDKFDQCALKLSKGSIL